MARSTRASALGAGSTPVESKSDITVATRRYGRKSNVTINSVEEKVTVTPTRSGRRVVEAVVIKQTMVSGSRSAPSDTSVSTTNPSIRNSSVEDDMMTPATSLSTTPALSVRGRAPSGPKFTLGGLPVASSNKRKRPVRATSIVKAEDISRDEELAQSLQAEEYEERSGIYNKGKGKGKATLVEDSDAESALSSLGDMDFDEDLSDISDVPLAKKRRTKLSSGSSTEAGPSRPRSTRKSAIIKTAINNALDELSELEELSSVADSDFELMGEEVDGDSDANDVSAEASRQQSVDSVADTGTADPSMQALQTAASNRRFKRGRFARRNARALEEALEPYDRKKARRKKLEKAHPEIKTMWADLRKVPIITPVQAQQPTTITRRLKEFQLEGLDWMIKQEKSSYKGGLLGDEMGMGKTIQAVSLIMSDHPAPDPTLVLVPPVALMQWANEIKEYTNGKLNVLIVHNTNKESKNLTPKLIRKYDAIIMSYNSLESMYRKQEKGWTRGEDLVKEDSPIHSIKFHRLVLDEAHSIKSRTTGVAKACFALKGKYKWCLSGTPVQNRIGEFFSLLRFLEVRPFADYFCEKCDCAQLHWSIDASSFCKSCKHSAAEHVSVFNQELLNPIIGESLRGRKAALDKLHMITARVMLRRMKKDHTSSMELPPKEVVIHNEFFGEIERDFSSSIMSNTTRKFDTYVAQGVMLNNYANIFGLIMQMRQVANHPDLLLKKHAEGGQNVLVCNICDEPAEEAIRSKCHHEFCRGCAKQYVQSCEGAGGDADCPRCHIPLEINWDQMDIEQDAEQVKKTSIINRIKMENWTSSTKIEMLVYDLYKLRSKKQTLKSIVFSQFTSMLQLIEWRLRRAGFNTVMLDGSMTPAQRQRSIDYFMNNADVEVFLVSLKAGGVALNLTEASRVFIVDPWWNPAAEWQSADRCHRIGQTRPCVITRLVVEDSVESRMVMLQEKKANMIGGTINNDKVAMDKLSPEDLQFLFRGT